MFEAFVKKENAVSAPFKEWMPWWVTTEKPSNIDIQEVASLTIEEESVNLNTFLEYIDESPVH